MFEQDENTLIQRQVFEHSPEGIFVIGVDVDGVFRLEDANPAWERMTGLRIAQLRGLRFDATAPAATLDRLARHHRECLRRQSRFEYHETLPTPSGLRRYHVSLTPIPDTSGRIYRILAVARDAPADVAGTHRLSILEAVVDQVHEAVYLLDNQGRPHYVNDEARRMLGYERAELMGMSVWHFDPTWSAERWHLDWPSLQTRGWRTFETVHRTRDGRLIPVEIMASYASYGECGYVLALVRDISERQRTQAQLLENELRYRDVFNNVSDALYLLEVTEDGRFRNVDVNPAFERATGIPAVALIGRCVDEAVPADVADVVMAKYRRCVATAEAIEEEATLDLPTGRRVFHSTVIPVRDGSGRIHRIVGVSRDITERKRAEQEFRTLVEHSPDTVARYDLDCRRTYANPTLVRAAGLPMNDLLGLRPGELLTPDPGTAQRYEDHIRAVLASGQDGVFNLHWQGSQGEAFTSQIRLVAERDAGGSIVSVLAIGRDVSSLIETQRQLRALIEIYPDIVSRYDCSGRIVYVSPASARRFGRPLSEYVGKSVAELDPEHGPPFADAIRQVVEKGLPRQLELPYPMRGELRYWEVRFMPELGEQGRVTGVLGIGRDITERKQTEQMIRDLHRRREAAREDERRHIARELHDEMGQYLSALRMEVSLLRMGQGAEDPALREKTRSLLTMVDHLIQVTRNLVHDLRPTVLDHGVASALEWLIDDFRRRSGMASQLHIGDVPITLDAQQTVMVFRIVQESLTNVLRHAKANRVDVMFEWRGGDCALEIRDDGCGFDVTLRPHGSLGLVGLRERVQMLGGQLAIGSSPGAGTVISVAFPAKGGDSHR